MKIEGAALVGSQCRKDMEVVVLRMDARHRCVPEGGSGARKQV